MDFAHGFLLFCTLLGFYNLGIIWLAQLVIYPLFAKVGTAEYIDYHTFYSSHIPLPVILPGFTHFLVPIVLLFYRPESVSLAIALANVVCGLLSLVVTVALEIPRHNRLEKFGKQEAMIQELIRYNWPRTFGIVGSALLTLVMLTQAFTPIV